MEQAVSNLATVRLVDIEKEILKGKTVKPGILHDDATPGPSHVTNFTEYNQNVSSQLMQPIVANTFIANQGMRAPVPKISMPNMTTYVLNSMPTEHRTQQVGMRYVIAKESTPSQSKNVPPILRRTPQLVTKTVPVDKMWSEIKNGVRFVHPSNLDKGVLNKVVDTLKTEKTLKNTIISLPNSVYLVPLSCFKGAPLPPGSMVSIATEIPTDKNETRFEVPQKLSHPCWNTKRNRKIDLDGFSAYDRLGFYKSESARSRKCQKHVDAIIDRLRNSIGKIREELEVLGTNKHKKLVQKKQSPNKKEIQSKQLKKRRRKRVPTDASNTQKFSFPTIPAQQLAAMDHDSLSIIDDMNFETYEQHKFPIFVSKDIIVTEMIVDSFPNFKEAVEKGLVKIVMEQDFISVFGVELVKSEPQVADASKHVQFVKFLGENRDVLLVLNDHSYAASDGRV